MSYESALERYRRMAGADSDTTDPLGLGGLPALSMIFTIYDEEPDEVKATLESAAAAYPEDRLEFVVVDDGGEPVLDAVESAETGEPVAVEHIRNEPNVGVGRARNQGVEAASGDVLSFHDAHMRFPLHDELMEYAEKSGHELNIPEGWSSLMVLANNAWTDRCIISSASRDVWTERGFYASGADLFWNRRDGLQPKWQMPRKWERQWKRVACMMGAGYFMSRNTAEILAEATAGSADSGRDGGRPRLGPEPSQYMDGHTTPDTACVWEDTAGKWGFSEQALSVKAFLLDIPIYATRDIFTRHIYRGSNPVEGAGREVWKNVTRCTSRLFPPDMWEARFAPHCRKRLGDEADNYRAEYAGLADRYECGRVFTDLVGKNAPVTGRHPDHEWLDEVNEACSTLADARVLMWRPGEALFSVLDFAPESDITCIAAPGPRANNWWDVCRANGVDIVKARLDDDYVERPLKRDWGPFDLVLINGPLQEECVNIATRVLAEGGRIVRNERADRAQLEDEQKKKEKKNVEAALKKRSPEATVSAQPSSDPASEVGPLTVTAPPGGWSGGRSYMYVLTDVLREREPDRILEWGPGYSTYVMHTYCPDADIVTTEHQERFAEKARKQRPYASVRHEPLTDYGKCDYAVWPFLEGAGPFDLVFIDGRRRSECLLAARRVLTDDGLAVLHDSDRKNYDLGRELYETVREENRTAVLKPIRG